MELFDFNLDAQLVKELNNIEKDLTVDLDDEDALPTAQELERSKSLKQNRVSMMAPRMNEDDSDVEVDVVAGVTQAGAAESVRSS
jgi:hypothetical protein